MGYQRTKHRFLRLTVSALAGVGIGFLASLGRLDLALYVGWVVAALGYSLWTWGRLWRLDAEEVARHAREEDPGRAWSDVLLLAVALTSIAGVGKLLLGSHTSDDWAAAVGVLTVVSSWVLTHTVYGMRYADLYFAAPKPPIDFGDEPPTYADFAYVSFCLGMTYQISDTNLRTGALRRAVLAHTLLSYFLGVVVIGCTVNLVAGLGS